MHYHSQSVVPMCGTIEGDDQEMALVGLQGVTLALKLSMVELEEEKTVVELGTEEGEVRKK